MAVMIAIVRTLSALLTTWVCSQLGRRKPALWSGMVMSLSLLALAITPHYFTSPITVSSALLLIYVLSSSLGFSALPWSMLGEIFPTNFRGVSILNNAFPPSIHNRSIVITLMFYKSQNLMKVPTCL